MRWWKMAQNKSTHVCFLSAKVVNKMEILTLAIIINTTIAQGILFESAGLMLVK